MRVVDSFGLMKGALPVAILVMSQGVAAAAAPQWLQRVEGYAAVGLADVRARPETGGAITMSFDDSDTAGVDKAIIGGSGRDTDALFPSVQLGARLRILDDLTAGIEGQYAAFDDALSTTPLDAPGSTPQANFATYQETSLFKLKARDIGATVGYSRWNGTAEALVGWRDGSFETRAQIDAFGVFTTGNFVNMGLSTGSSFKGDGALFALRLSYALPALPVRIVARHAYSKLGGESDSFGRAVGTVASSPSPPLVGAATVTRNNADQTKATIHDQEYGLQLEFAARGAISRSYVRVSWMQTSWKLDGPPTGGAGFGGTIADLTVNSFASGGLGKGKLAGMALTVGAEF